MVTQNELKANFTYNPETGRNNDAEDFHDVSVWELKRALEAAYAAGAKSQKNLKA